MVSNWSGEYPGFFRTVLCSNFSPLVYLKASIMLALRQRLFSKPLDGLQRLAHVVPGRGMVDDAEPERKPLPERRRSHERGVFPKNAGEYVPVDLFQGFLVQGGGLGVDPEAHDSQ